MKDYTNYMDQGCPKCGCLSITPEYILKDRYTDVSEEHLRWTCACGYSLNTKCKEVT
jgi:hypothetical protein